MNAFRILALAGLLPAAAVAQPLDRRPATPVEELRRLLPPGRMPGVEAAPAFNGLSAKMFATRVQPVLANVCAHCHARPDFAGGFKLRRIPDGYADPAATEHNLRAAVRQLNPLGPASSPLLLKAVAAHGPAKEPPLRGTNLPPYKVLELWAHWAVLPEGAAVPTSLAPAVARTAPAMPLPGNGTFAAGTDPPAAGAKPAEPPVAVVPPGTVVEHVTMGSGTGVPALPAAPAEPGRLPPTVRGPSPDDPYDPAGFNRYAHPQRTP